jgi:hypothetical protein
MTSVILVQQRPTWCGVKKPLEVSVLRRIHLFNSVCSSNALRARIQISCLMFVETNAVFQSSLKKNSCEVRVTSVRKTTCTLTPQAAVVQLIMWLTTDSTTGVRLPTGYEPQRYTPTPILYAPRGLYGLNVKLTTEIQTVQYTSTSPYTFMSWCLVTGSDLPLSYRLHSRGNTMMVPRDRSNRRFGLWIWSRSIENSFKGHFVNIFWILFYARTTVHRIQFTFSGLRNSRTGTVK